MSLGKKRIFIVDDHPIVRKGLIQVINKQKNMETCGSAADAASALSFLEKDKPDLLILDISLENSNGLDLLKDISARNENIPVLVLSMHDENVYAERALNAGARGYIMKQRVTKELIKAILTVLAGKIYLSDEVSSKILDKKTKNDSGNNSDITDILSDRELEVLQYTGEGLTTEEIAGRLNLGIKSIETYKSKIKDKLDLKNSNRLIKFAVEWVISKNNTR